MSRLSYSKTFVFSLVNLKVGKLSKRNIDLSLGLRNHTFRMVLGIDGKIRGFDS